MQNISGVPSYVSMAHGAAATGHTYSTTQVTNLLNFAASTPNVQLLAARVDLLHSDRSYKSDLTPWITSLSVVHDTAQPVHRSASLTMAETAASQTVDLGGGVVTSANVDYLNDLVEVWIGIGVGPLNTADTGYIMWSQGVFNFKRPGAQVPDFAVVRTAELIDLSYRLQEQATTQSLTNLNSPEPFTLPQGAFLIDVVYGLIVNGTDGTNNTGIAALSGMPGANLSTIFVNYGAWPSSSTLDATVPATYTFNADTNYLDIANTLLRYLNCYDLWVDENGAFNVTPWPPNQNYTVLPASFTFDTQNNSIIFPGVTEDFLLDDIANVVLVKVEDATRTTFSALAVNKDPSSPYSVANWGRRVVKEVDDSNIPNASAQNWVQLYANQQLIINAYLTDQVTMETAVVPIFQDHDVVALNIEQTDVSAGTQSTQPVVVASQLPGIVISERWLSLKWQIDMVLAEPDAGRNLAGATGYTTMLDTRNTPPASKMTHTLNRVTSVFNPGSSGQNIGTS